jgi:DNA sulfur modification protein DndD
MKLKSVRIQNFKLLRDVRLEFSELKDRPLTVIRAENGSGKTSTLVALRWGLYGQDGLDAPNVRLSPTSWPDGIECEIKVQLDFSHTLYNQIAGEFVPTTTDYRLVRTVVERPEGDRPNRETPNVLLYQFTEGGLDRLDVPELLIGQMLPLEMKDIFFTDGDAAMSFISPQLTRGSKRDQVRDAIRSLLGLGLLESAASHIATAQKRYNAEISKASGAGQLADVATKLAQTKEALEQDRRRLRDVERQIEELARRYEEADKRLQLALQAGDHVELAAQKEQAQRQRDDARDNEGLLKTRHQQLLQDERLALALMGPTLGKGYAQLVALHDAGVIPSGSIPVLEERLDLGVCICGTELSPGTETRLAVENLIALQKTVDDKRKLLTELHHAAKVDLQRETTVASDWLNDLNGLERTRLNNRKVESAAKDQLRVCEEKLSRIDEASVDQVRKERDSLRVSLNAKEDERRELQTRIDQAAAAVAELTPQYDSLRRKDQRLDQLNDRLTVTEDMAAVVDGALDDIQQTYMARVSQRLNELFLEMVGADPAVMAQVADGDQHRMHVFKSATITENYEIAVYSADNRTLNPDHELSGAQKRALTFSFIWALTEVSGLIAPRIIDTPLGMMSGAVKKRVLELITAPTGEAADIEKQVILFLTRDEIRGTEDVIDARAGKVFTYTNTDHYPVDVVSDPGVDAPEILVCTCSHRQACKVCARRNDALYGLIERPLA